MWDRLVVVYCTVFVTLRNVLSDLFTSLHGSRFINQNDWQLNVHHELRGCNKRSMHDMCENSADIQLSQYLHIADLTSLTKVMCKHWIRDSCRRIRISCSQLLLLLLDIHDLASYLTSRHVIHSYRAITTVCSIRDDIVFIYRGQGGSMIDRANYDLVQPAEFFGPSYSASTIINGLLLYRCLCTPTTNNLSWCRQVITDTMNVRSTAILCMNHQQGCRQKMIFEDANMFGLPVPLARREIAATGCEPAALCQNSGFRFWKRKTRVSGSGFFF